MAALEKEQILFNDNPNINKIKYGDADLCSKRRKLHKINEQEEEESDEDKNDGHINISADETYLKFQTNANANCCQSSFIETDSSTNDIEEESKDDYVTNRTHTFIPNKFQSSAKNDLIITNNPSISSKGFENTFKLLQNQVKTNSQKSIDLIKTINPDSEFPSCSLSSLGVIREEEPTCLELELEAMQRIQVYVNNLEQIKRGETKKDELSTPLLELLYNFVSRGISQDFTDETEDLLQTKPLSYDSEYNSNFMYHVSKNAKGVKCLKIVRNLLKHEKGILINFINFELILMYN